MQLYEYVKKEPSFALQLQESNPHWLRYEVSFRTAHPNRYQAEGIACGEYCVPPSAKCSPLVILVHGLGAFGERNVAPCRILARELVKMGIASFILELLMPAQAEKGKRMRLSGPYIENWMELYQVLVINIHQVIDWAENRSELDAHRVAVIGVSVGGMASAIAMGVDKRITAGVFIVTGGDMGKIMWRKNAEAQLNRECTKAQCHEIYSHYPQYLADVAEKGIENVVPTKECFLFDPLTFAPYLYGRPTLMINAEHDDSVPKDAALEFWQACGQPRIVWLPADHQSIFLRRHSIRREAIALLSPAFGMKNED